MKNELKVFEQFEKEFPSIAHYRQYQFGKSLTQLKEFIIRLFK